MHSDGTEVAQVRHREDSRFDAGGTPVLTRRSSADHRRPAALLGASDALRDDHDVQFPAVVLPFVADAESQARTALGEQPYEQAYELGVRTPVPQLLEARDDALHTRR
jgi:hypothetical protein